MLLIEDVFHDRAHKQTVVSATTHYKVTLCNLVKKFKVMSYLAIAISFGSVLVILSGFKNLSNFGLNVDKIVLLALGIPIRSQLDATLLHESKQTRDILNRHSITGGVVADLRDLGPYWS